MQKIIIDYKKCRSCGICEIACPQKIIERHTSGSVFVKPAEEGFADYCFICLKCINICPEKNITIISNKSNIK